MSCCLKMPVALLEPALNGSGQLVGINNVSQYNDFTKVAFLRRAEWYIFKNNRIVYSFGMDYLNRLLSIGGNRTQMTFANGATTVFNFLAANHIPRLPSDIIEVAIKVKNYKGYQSNLSNKILISAAAPTSCNGYKLQVGGVLYGAVDPSGNCYVPQ